MDRLSVALYVGCVVFDFGSVMDWGRLLGGGGGGLEGWGVVC